MNIEQDNLNMKMPARDAGAMAQFIKNMAKTDKELYDRLSDLMKFFNLLDIDLRLVSQLKACFISKE